MIQCIILAIGSIAVIYLVYIHLLNKLPLTIPYRSSDGTFVNILDNAIDPNISAEMLVYLATVLEQVMEYAYVRFRDDEEFSKEMEIYYERFKEKFIVSKTMFENSSDNWQGDTSYTLNKKYLVMCLEDENKNYHDINTLAMVAVHELVHYIIDDVEHTEKFWSIYSKMMTCAREIGAYKDVDYGKHPITYCKNVYIDHPLN